MRLYKNLETGEVLTRRQFEELARDYINSREWEDGGRPTVSEVMLNMDDVIELDEE